MNTLPKCVKCGTDITLAECELARKTYQALSREYKTPKVCSSCVWTSLVNMGSEPPTKGRSDV